MSDEGVEGVDCVRGEDGGDFCGIDGFCSNGLFGKCVLIPSLAGNMEVDVPSGEFISLLHI